MVLFDQQSNKMLNSSFAPFCSHSIELPLKIASNLIQIKIQFGLRLKIFLSAKKYESECTCKVLFKHKD
jgi:hypothetical protein